MESKDALERFTRVALVVDDEHADPAQLNPRRREGLIGLPDGGRSLGELGQQHFEPTARRRAGASVPCWIAISSRARIEAGIEPATRRGGGGSASWLAPKTSTATSVDIGGPPSSMTIATWRVAHLDSDADGHRRAARAPRREPNSAASACCSRCRSASAYRSSESSVNRQDGRSCRASASTFAIAARTTRAHGPAPDARTACRARCATDPSRHPAGARPAVHGEGWYRRHGRASRRRSFPDERFPSSRRWC